MKRKIISQVALLFTLLAVSGVSGQSLSVTGPARVEMTEGRTYTITWVAGGAETVNIAVYGERTSLGTQTRGTFQIVAAKGIPAADGEFQFEVPWIDARHFAIKIKGYDRSGMQVGMDERSYAFRPAIMASRTADGIYLDLHERNNQRVYMQKDRRITHIYVSSSSENYHWLSRTHHISQPHDHAGVYRVIEKRRSHWSSLYNVRMPYAMRYLGGHFIHATSTRYYKLLGGPASHGCNRLTLHDAQELYNMTPIGARVEVIGPKG